MHHSVSQSYTTVYISRLNKCPCSCWWKLMNRHVPAADGSVLYWNISNTEFQRVLQCWISLRGCSSGVITACFLISSPTAIGLWAKWPTSLAAADTHFDIRWLLTLSMPMLVVNGDAQLQLVCSAVDVSPIVTATSIFYICGAIVDASHDLLWHVPVFSNISQMCCNNGLRVTLVHWNGCQYRRFHRPVAVYITCCEWQIRIIADAGPYIRSDSDVLDLSCQMGGQSTCHLLVTPPDTANTLLQTLHRACVADNFSKLIHTSDLLTRDAMIPRCYRYRYSA